MPARGSSHLLRTLPRSGPAASHARAIYFIRRQFYRAVEQYSGEQLLQRMRSVFNESWAHSSFLANASLSVSARDHCTVRDGGDVFAGRSEAIERCARYEDRPGPIRPWANVDLRAHSSENPKNSSLPVSERSGDRTGSHPIGGLLPPNPSPDHALLSNLHQLRATARGLAGRR